MKYSNQRETQAGKSQQGLLAIALLPHCPAAIVIRRNEKPRNGAQAQLFSCLFLTLCPFFLPLYFFSGTTRLEFAVCAQGIPVCKWCWKQCYEEFPEKELMTTIHTY